MTPQQIADQKAQQPKPPLGLMPRDIWVSQRVDEIWHAIDRYAEAGRDIPAKWMQELRDHQSPRDVLRVVQPDAGGAMEQVAPVQDEPTEAELVGEKCWVRDGDSQSWRGPYKIIGFFPEDVYPYVGDVCAWNYAKLYREGVTP